MGIASSALLVIYSIIYLMELCNILHQNQSYSDNSILNCPQARSPIMKMHRAAYKAVFK